MFSPHIDHEEIRPPLPFPEVRGVKRSSSVEQVSLEPDQQCSGVKHPFRSRIREIPSKALALCGNDKWMLFARQSFNVARNACKIAGHAAGKAVPILSIAGSPFYMYHACHIAKKRFGLMVQAAKTKRVADAVFWGGRGTGMLSMTLSDTLRPLMGITALAGLTLGHSLALVCTIILPITLIVFTTVGGASRGWEYMRVRNALKKFQENRELQMVAELLKFLQGPDHIVAKEDAATDALINHKLDEKKFESTHFTSNARKEAIQARINKLHEHDLHLIRSLQEKVASEEIGETAITALKKRLRTAPRENIFSIARVISTIHHLQSIGLESLEKKFMPHEVVGELLGIVDELEGYPEAKKVSEILKEAQNELMQIEKEGRDILDTAEVEMKRKLQEITLKLIVVALVLIASALLLASANYKVVGAAILLSAFSVDLIYILHNEVLSQEQYKRLHDYLLSF